MNFAAKYLVMPLIVLLCGVTIAHASAVLTIPSAGIGSIAVQGSGLDKVASIDLQIVYDPSTMNNPRVIPGGVSAGAGTVLSANTSQTGTILISVVKKFPMSISETGQIAQISFDSPGGSPATITNFAAKLLDVNGAQIGAQAVIIQVDMSSKDTSQDGGSKNQPTDNPSAGGSSSNQSTDNLSEGGGGTTQPGGTTQMAGTPRPLAGGTLTMPSEGGETEAKGGKESPASETTVALKDGSGGTSEQVAKAEPRGKPAEQPVVEKKSIVYKSVLEQVRVFQGERTPGALTALFTAAAVPGVRQEPAIVLTDGSTKAKVSIELPAAGKDTPNFALSGAQMVSIRTEGSAWVVEVVPDKGVAQASITAVQGPAVTEIPLTVAPRVALNTGKNGIADEAAFTRFLKERGSEKSPQFDLNGDGVRDYIDDYIYTANYLAQPVLKEKEPMKQMENGKKKEPANQKK